MRGEPKIGIVYVAREAGMCDLCRRVSTGRGLVGWQWPAGRPVCDRCFEKVDPPLAVALCLIMSLRELASMDRDSGWYDIASFGMAGLFRRWVLKWAWTTTAGNEPFELPEDPSLLLQPDAQLGQPEDRPRHLPAIIHTLEPGQRCAHCADAVGMGLIGWNFRGRTGALCLDCLGLLSRPLAHTLTLLRGGAQLISRKSRGVADGMFVAFARNFHYVAEPQWPVRSKQMLKWLLRIHAAAHDLDASLLVDDDETLPRRTH